MPRKQKKYHYIYKTTCQVTGKFYVGMHSTDNLEDGYLGSGKILGYSIGKHGRENHKKEILEFCETRECLKRLEKEMVNEELLTHPLNINLKYGGEGGWDHLAPAVVRSNAIKNSPFKLGHIPSQITRMKISASSSSLATQRWARDDEHLKAALVKAIEAAASRESSTKRSVTMKARGHSQGTKNSQFGTCWVKKNESAMKIKLDLLDEYLKAGWVRGR